MKEIVIATRNRKKLLELRRLLKVRGLKILSLCDFNALPKIKEDGKTFRTNARKKALGVSSRIDKIVLADDSGLEVPALGNRPGVNSARYAHPSQNDNKNIAKLLKNMDNFTGKKRRAQFRCVVCLSKGRRVIGVVEGEVKGKITSQPKGRSGFGYDPVFIPDGFDKSFAQLGSRVKDRISHRAAALKKASQILRQIW